MARRRWWWRVNWYVIYLRNWKEVEGAHVTQTDRTGFSCACLSYPWNSSQSKTWVAMYIYLSVHIFEMERKAAQNRFWVKRRTHTQRPRSYASRNLQGHICNAAAVKAVKMRRNGGGFNGWNVRMFEGKRNEEEIRNNQKVLIWTIYKHAISFVPCLDNKT